MNTNKTTFKDLIKQKIIRVIIFEHIKNIHSIFCKPRYIYDNTLARIKWANFGDWPNQLVRYGYTEKFKKEMDLAYEEYTKNVAIDKQQKRFLKFLNELDNSVYLNKYDIAEHIVSKYYSIVKSKSHLIFYAKDLKMVKMIHKYINDVEIGEVALLSTVMKGNLDILKYLIEYGNAICSYKIMDRAATRGYLEIVQYLYEKGMYGSMESIDQASFNGHTEVVRFLVLNRKVEDCCSEYALIQACTFGHFEIVKILCENLTFIRSYINQAKSWAYENRNTEIYNYLTDLNK